MNQEPLPIIFTEKPVSHVVTRAKGKLVLLTVVGGLAYAVANNASMPSYKPSSGLFATTMVAAPASAESATTTADSTSAATGTAQTGTRVATPTVLSQAAPTAAATSTAAPVRARTGVTIYPVNSANTVAQSSQILIPAQSNLLTDSNPAGAPQPRMPRSSITIEATPVIEAPEKEIPLLGPVIRESGRPAFVAPPFLICTIEVLERGAPVSHQTIGCTQSDQGERPAMLMEFGQEVPNEIPNMKYWLSVQVDGYRHGYPILRTRMELKGLLGRAFGRRKYESVTVVEPNMKHTVIAFNIDDDDFAVTISARKQ